SGTLGDAEAKQVVLDLADLALIFREEGNTLGGIHWSGIEPCLAAGDAAVQPMANHIDKFTICKAQLAQAQTSSGSRQEHVFNVFDMTDLNSQEIEYCKGRLAYIDSQHYQGGGKWPEAETSYLQAIAHLQKADSPEYLAKT